MRSACLDRTDQLAVEAGDGPGVLRRSLVGDVVPDVVDAAHQEHVAGEAVEDEASCVGVLGPSWSGLFGTQGFEPRDDQ